MPVRFLPAPVTESPPPPPTPELVLFGRDRGGKPRAAWFVADQVEAATAAAGTMKLQLLPVADEAQRTLAGQLARGRIMPNGKAHVPSARRDLFGRLVALAGGSPAPNGTGAGQSGPEKPDQPAVTRTVAAGTEQLKPSDAPAGTDEGSKAAAEPAAATSSPTEPAKPKFGDHNFVGSPIPHERDQIGLGSLVLAHESPEEGWWEAEVIGMNGRVFSCRWRDFAGTDTFLRYPGELALLPPGKD